MRVFIGPPGEDEVTGGQEAVEIEIHEHDDVSRSIAHIALACIRRERARTRDGIPYVSMEDVPAPLRDRGDGSNPPTDGRDAARWAYAVDEIEWACEQLLEDHRALDQFVIEPGEHILIPTGPGRYDVATRRKGVMDMEGVHMHAARIDEGLRLFTRYMAHL